ncbi:MAG: hypothetical protein JXR87_10720 [Candidatus Marinimicrobia bacterium]|nr:hypothetical protein [Candidatus Neomarinimicrobiota bacterium]
MKPLLKNIINSDNGVTLAETAVAILIMTILIIGGLQFVSVGREQMTVEKYQRIALIIAESRLETVRKYSWEILSDSLSESNTSIMLKDVLGTRTTVVTDIDDDFDGTGGSDLDANTVDYKHIEVTVAWALTQSLSLETDISEYFYDMAQ